MALNSGVIIIAIRCYTPVWTVTSLVKVVKLFLFKLMFDFFNQLLTDNRRIRIKTIAHCTESGQSRWHYRVAAMASVASCGSSCGQAWQWLPPPFLDFHSSRTFKLRFSGWSGTLGGTIILHSHLHMAHTCLTTLEICILRHYHQPLWCSVCSVSVGGVGKKCCSFLWSGLPDVPCTDCLLDLVSCTWSYIIAIWDRHELLCNLPITCSLVGRQSNTGNLNISYDTVKPVIDFITGH